MTWLLKANSDPTAIYQSPDFPHVFLGSMQLDDMMDAEKMAGQPICIRIDLTNESLRPRDLQSAPQSFRLPEATMKVPLPDEPKDLPLDQQAIWQQEFNKASDQLAEIISKNNCPIYVHCSVGMNRSVATLLAALSKLTGKPIGQLHAEMKSIRGMINPNPMYTNWAAQYSQNLTRPQSSFV